MTTRKRKDVESAFVKKGFEIYKADHRFYFYFHNGSQVARTKVSHGTNDIGDFLLAKMARQCHLSKADFLNLVDCPMTQEEYESNLKNNGILSE